MEHYCPPPHHCTAAHDTKIDMDRMGLNHSGTLAYTSIVIDGQIASDRLWECMKLNLQMSGQGPIIVQTRDWSFWALYPLNNNNSTRPSSFRITNLDE